MCTHASRAVRLWLNHGKKPDVAGAHFLEKAIDLRGVANVVILHHAQDIVRDMVAPQKLGCAQRVPVRWLSALARPVTVVHFLRAVQTEPNAKLFRRQKPAPILIEQDPVGLHAICLAAHNRIFKKYLA